MACPPFPRRKSTGMGMSETKKAATVSRGSLLFTNDSSDWPTVGIDAKYVWDQHRRKE